MADDPLTLYDRLYRVESDLRYILDSTHARVSDELYSYLRIAYDNVRRALAVTSTTASNAHTFAFASNARVSKQENPNG